MTYQYVDIEHPIMQLAFHIGKHLYKLYKWNKKAVPIAIIVSKEGVLLSSGVSAFGRHMVAKKCRRLKTRGTQYSSCPNCAEHLHAEQLALREIERLQKDPIGGAVYLFGHWKMCDSCIAACRNAGITDFFLLKNSEIYFDRHHEKTLIGKPSQYEKTAYY